MHLDTRAQQGNREAALVHVDAHDDGVGFEPLNNLLQRRYAFHRHAGLLCACRLKRPLQGYDKLGGAAWLFEKSLRPSNFFCVTGTQVSNRGLPERKVVLSSFIKPRIHDSNAGDLG
jgi:hypothetical protein